MIEILKIIGSALVTACATIGALYLKRKWEKQDKADETKDTMEDKIDKIANELVELSKKVEKFSKELDAETQGSNTRTVALQAGLREILYDRIKFLCKKYESEGRIREEEYKSLKRMWQVYHEDLKGNGYLNNEIGSIETLEKY